jgi:hypothetical protein
MRVLKTWRVQLHCLEAEHVVMQYAFEQAQGAYSDVPSAAMLGNLICASRERH